MIFSKKIQINCEMWFTIKFILGAKNSNMFLNFCSNTKKSLNFEAKISMNLWNTHETFWQLFETLCSLSTHQLINSRRKNWTKSIISTSVTNSKLQKLLCIADWVKEDEFSSNNSNGLFPTFHGWYAKKVAVPHIKLFVFLISI